MSISKKTIALIGNPNVGKTTLFNLLTGLNQKVGNFPGVTIEKKTGQIKFSNNETANIIDLPGTYSLSSSSPDQVITVDILLQRQQGVENIDAIVAIIDAANLERNLYLISQVLELQIPTVIALNMQDEAIKKGIKINTDRLSEMLHCPIVEVIANQKKGIEKLLDTLQKNITNKPTKPNIDFGGATNEAIKQLQEFFTSKQSQIGREVHQVETIRLLLDSESIHIDRMKQLLGDEFSKLHKDMCTKIGSELERISLESETRYKEIETITSSCVTMQDTSSAFSKKLDKILTHPLVGSTIFLFVMLFVFQAIYSWSGPLMDTIDMSFAWFGDTVGAYLPEGTLKSLIVDGIIAGIGAVLIFLPQILILFAFIALLEDCGYMARAAFLMDRTMKSAGLSGHSFIPMLSSFACAIPGVMAARVIKNPRDRLATILVAPLMSCSARLPVYTIMIGAFIPASNYLGGWIGLQGLVLFGMYLVGIVIAFPISWILKNTILKGPQSEFVMEMPTYKFPHVPTVMMKMYLSGKAFVVKAGTFIFLVTIVVWAMAYFPRSEAIEKTYADKEQQIENNFDVVAQNIWKQIPEDTQQKIQQDLEKLGELDEESYEGEFEKVKQKYPSFNNQIILFSEECQKYEESISINEQQKVGAHLRNSILGRTGSYIEPIVKPLGWNWKIGVATVASFPAREVIIATLGIIYNLGADEDEESSRLRSAMKNDRWPDGSLVFTPLVAISVMIFFALCCQCGATLGVIWRETNTWRWPLFTFVYMTVLAYFCSFVVYQVGTLLGW